MRERLGRMTTAARRWFKGTPTDLDVPLNTAKVLSVDEHGEAPTKIGVCCSGGGIRSASFCLGALQVLQERGELKPDTVVTAVSGGSYIASSYAALSHASDPGTVGGAATPVYAPGSPEEQYLRINTKYMAPGMGGKVRMGLRVISGIVVNLLWILMFVSVLAFVFAEAYDWIYGLRDGHGDIVGSLGAIPRCVWIPIASAGGLGALALMPDLLFRIRSDGLRTFFEAWTYRLVMGAAVAALLLIAIPALVVAVAGFDKANLSIIPAIDAKDLESLATIGGSAFGLAALGALRTVVAKRPTAFALFAGVIAGPLLITSVALAFMLGYLRDDGGYDIGAGLAIGAAVALAIGWFWADITQWSLHPFYRRRLSTAFFTRRVWDQDKKELRVEEIDYKEPLFLTELKNQPFKLTVCAAANITHLGVVPPGRAATPFSFSKDSIGGPLVGNLLAEERPDDASRDAKGGNPNAAEALSVGQRTARDITLPAAVAMSGAAVSPLMGKKSKRAYTMLMALLNVRLGVWVPNPRRTDHKTSRFPGDRTSKPQRTFSRRRPTPIYLIKELLGMAKFNDRFLYVSDGGHYDNLGLVELLREGCTRIYCLDGGGDAMGTFTALGEAVAMAKSDLQVDVEINPESCMIPDKDTRVAACNNVHGHVQYLTNVKGKRYQAQIVYTRATITKDAPENVLAYKAKTRKFPHHSTADQFFDDEKFESYRSLGAHCGASAFESMSEALQDEFKPPETPAAARGSLVDRLRSFAEHGQ